MDRSIMVAVRKPVVNPTSFTVFRKRASSFSQYGMGTIIYRAPSMCQRRSSDLQLTLVQRCLHSNAMFMLLQYFADKLRKFERFEHVLNPHQTQIRICHLGFSLHPHSISQCRIPGCSYTENRRAITLSSDLQTTGAQGGMGAGTQGGMGAGTLLKPCAN